MDRLNKLMFFSRLIAILFSALFLFAVAVPVFAVAEKEVPLFNPLAGEYLKNGQIQGATNGSLKGEAFLTDRLVKLLQTMFAIFSVLALIPVVVGGIRLITSQGNSEQVEAGKKTLLWGVVGLVLAFSGILVFSVLLQILTPQ